MKSSFGELPVALKYAIPCGIVLAVATITGLTAGWYWALVFICALLALALLWVAVGYLGKVIEKRRHGEMEGALSKVDDDELPDEELRREREDVREQWTKAREELRNCGFSLYSLPWYLLIGEPSGGKSTTLRASGLEFPVGTEAISGVGGTRNCDWWFTNEAIIVDTAGRFTFEDKNSPDAVGWKEFLGLLKRYRTRCPINGVIVAIPCTSLLGDSKEAVESKASVIRNKLHELQQELEIQFPVYVLITKSDKMLGFTEFFSRLPALEQHKQLFGWSNDEHYAKPVDNDKWSARFKTLLSTVHRWRAQFLVDDCDARDVDRLCAFPAEFATIESNFSLYMQRIFADNRFLDPLFMRGFYFTSGVQKGAPIVSACAKMLKNASGSSDEADLEKVFTKSRAFFIRGFYRKKVFLEQGLVHPTRRAMKRRQLISRIGYGSLAAAGLLFSVALIVGSMQVFSRTHELAQQLQGSDKVEDEWIQATAAEIREVKEHGLAKDNIQALFRSRSADDMAETFRFVVVQKVMKKLAARVREVISQAEPKTWQEYEILQKAVENYFALAAKPESQLPADLVPLRTRLDGLLPLIPMSANADTSRSATSYANALQSLLEIEALVLSGEPGATLSEAFVLDEAFAQSAVEVLRRFWCDRMLAKNSPYGDPAGIDSHLPLSLQPWVHWSWLIYHDGRAREVQAELSADQPKGWDVGQVTLDRLREWQKRVAAPREESATHASYRADLVSIQTRLQTLSETEIEGFNAAFTDVSEFAKPIFTRLVSAATSEAVAGIIRQKEASVMAAIDKRRGSAEGAVTFSHNMRKIAVTKLLDRLVKALVKVGDGLQNSRVFASEVIAKDLHVFDQQLTEQLALLDSGAPDDVFATIPGVLRVARSELVKGAIQQLIRGSGRDLLVGLKPKLIPLGVGLEVEHAYTIQGAQRLLEVVAAVAAAAKQHVGSGTDFVTEYRQNLFIYLDDYRKEWQGLIEKLVKPGNDLFASYNRDRLQSSLELIHEHLQLPEGEHRKGLLGKLFEGRVREGAIQDFLFAFKDSAAIQQRVEEYKKHQLVFEDFKKEANADADYFRPWLDVENPENNLQWSQLFQIHEKLTPNQDPISRAWLKVTDESIGKVQQQIIKKYLLKWAKLRAGSLSNVHDLWPFNPDSPKNAGERPFAALCNGIEDFSKDWGNWAWTLSDERMPAFFLEDTDIQQSRIFITRCLQLKELIEKPLSGTLFLGNKLNEKDLQGYRFDGTAFSEVWVSLGNLSEEEVGAAGLQNRVLPFVWQFGTSVSARGLKLEIFKSGKSLGFWPREELRKSDWLSLLRVIHTFHGQGIPDSGTSTFLFTQAIDDGKSRFGCAIEFTDAKIYPLPRSSDAWKN